MIRSRRFLAVLAAATALSGVASPPPARAQQFTGTQELTGAQALAEPGAAAQPGSQMTTPAAFSANGPRLPSADFSGDAQKQPFAFTADRLSYDKTGAIITATGHVRAVQAGRTLIADKVTFNRTTSVVTADGHVAIISPDGQTVFADHAVLNNALKNAVMQGVSARLGDNVRLIANGGERYGGLIDEFAKLVYSPCLPCQANPREAPFWQIRARTATRDMQHKMIEFRNAVLEIKGVPIAYFPYLSAPDPSAGRESGLLIPSIGSTAHLGLFYSQPYYFVLGRSADLTLTPVLATHDGPALAAEYRQAFNQGELNLQGTIGRDRGKTGDAVFSNGTFDLTDSWRAGFAYNRTSNPTFLSDFSVLPVQAYLSSGIYLEGFAPGAYTNFQVETFQGLVASVNQSTLPIVLPYGQYNFLSSPDAWGGQISTNLSVFDVLRNQGANTRRIALVPGYQLPFMLPYGVVGQARFELVAAGYNADKLNQQPDYSTFNATSTARAEPYGAVMLRWPLIRPSDHTGSLLLEPELQLVAAPNIGSSGNAKIPNEDSLDLEFSDANLFDLNRYPGIDRLEGGGRVDYALHGAWYLPSGASVDGLFGQSYRLHKDSAYLPYSGLSDNISDYVGHIEIMPVDWLDASFRTRLNHGSFGPRMIDTSVSVGNKTLSVNGGYFYSSTDQYPLYDAAPGVGGVTINPPAAYFTRLQELTAGFATNYGPWSLSADMTRNLATGSFDSTDASFGWANDCFGASVIYSQRFTSYNLDKGSMLVLFQLSFKTLGNLGFNGLKVL
jgi:LPS-assembly protein